MTKGDTAEKEGWGEGQPREGAQWRQAELTTKVSKKRSAEECLYQRRAVWTELISNI